MIKAIETRYKGYRFRSRIEAKWAVYFDALGITWEYEIEGFDLGELGWYLPDFWLPQVSMWAEVKSGAFSLEEIQKCCALAHGTGYSVILLDGKPSRKFYDVAEYFDADSRDFIRQFHPDFSFWDGDTAIRNSYVLVSDYHGYHIDEHRFYSCPGTDDPEDEGAWTDTAEAAVNAAKAARFEFGEQG